MSARGAVLLGLACAGCASLLSIPSGVPSFCARPENQGHSYCEDFDVGDPSTRWSYVNHAGGAAWSLASSDDSPPRLIDFVAPASDGGRAPPFAGFDKEFPELGFGAIHIEADLRIVTHGMPFTGSGGVLLITDKQGGCLAMAIVPSGIGLVNLASPDACSALTSTSSGGSGDGGATPSAVQLGPLPTLDTWLHMQVDVTPTPHVSDGSGTFTFNLVGQTANYAPVPIQPGTLPAAGSPLVGFALSLLPGSGPMQVQFDNVVVDARSP